MASEKRLIDANKIPYHRSGFPKGDGFDSRLDWAFREDIDNAPTVDAVEVVHGWWVHHYNDSDEPIDDKWYCSECHMCNDHKRTWYCPNCGAKMDGDWNA